MEISLKGHYAGFVSRLLAYFIDISVLAVTLVAFGWFINTVEALFPLDFLPGGVFRVLIASFIGFALVFGYFIFFWTLIGQTPGKMLLGLRVVSVHGGSVSPWQSIRRIGGYIISYVLFLGYLWILIDNRRQGWHDKIANTYVIYTWDARIGSFLAKEINTRQETNQVVQE